jgi:hypothetical protein
MFDKCNVKPLDYLTAVNEDSEGIRVRCEFIAFKMSSNDQGFFQPRPP